MKNTNQVNKVFREKRTYFEPTAGSYIGDIIRLVQENHPACSQFNGTLIFSNPEKSVEEIYNKFIADRKG